MDQQPGAPNAKAKTAWVHVKTTPSERDDWHAKATAAGLSLSDLIRQRLGNKPRRRRSVPVADPALVASLARIGNNLNQLARWANTHKAGADTVQILAALATTERILSFFLPPVVDVGGGGDTGPESPDDAH